MMSSDTSDLSKNTSKASEQVETPVEMSLVKLLNRYISVWLWSIILGSTVSAFMMIPRAREIQDYGSATFLLTFIMAFAYLAYIFAFMSLFNYLRRFIIPLVLGSTEEIHGDEGHQHYAYRSLPRAFQFLVLGLIAHGVLMIAMAFLTYMIRF